MPHQIIYHSRALHRGSHITDLDILNEAISFNTDHNISGFLLKTYDHFIQVMEGPGTVLIPLYQNITHDPRHFGVTTRFSNRIETRQFGLWTMGYDYQDGLTIPPTDGASDIEIARWTADIRQTLLTLSQKHQSENINPESRRKDIG